MARYFAPDGAASTTATGTGAAGTAGAAGAAGAAGGGAAAAGTGGNTGAQAAGDGTGGAAGAAGQQGPASSQTQSAAGAPAKYELKVPDDAKRFVPADELENIERVARESGWTNDQAQAEVNDVARRAITRFNAQLVAWENEVKADKDLGGDNLANTQVLTKRAIDAVLPEGHAARDGFLAFMKDSGGSVNIHAVRFLAALGKKLGEDTHTSGRGGGGTEANPADKMYTHPTSVKLQEERLKRG